MLRRTHAHVYLAYTPLVYRAHCCRVALRRVPRWDHGSHALRSRTHRSSLPLHGFADPLRVCVPHTYVHAHLARFDPRVGCTRTFAYVLDTFCTAGCHVLATHIHRTLSSFHGRCYAHIILLLRVASALHTTRFATHTRVLRSGRISTIERFTWHLPTSLRVDLRFTYGNRIGCGTHATPRPRSHTRLPRRLRARILRCRFTCLVDHDLTWVPLPHAAVLPLPLLQRYTFAPLRTALSQSAAFYCLVGCTFVYLSQFIYHFVYRILVTSLSTSPRHHTPRTHILHFTLYICIPLP